VIPAGIRRELGIRPGDALEVDIDREHQSVELRKPDIRLSKKLAGSLANHAKAKRHPTREQMRQALEKGLSDG
jgi:AbrB family looped-hinge helix DNA binding protein